MFILGAGLGFAHAEVEFRAYIVAAGEPQFILSLDRHVASRWISIGQAFEGFVITAFDAKDEALTIEKDGKQQVLRLIEGRIEPSVDGTRAHNSVIVSIDGGESIYLSSHDATAINAFKMRMTAVSVLVPQPVIRIRADKDSDQFLIKAVVDSLREVGIKRLSINSASKLQ